MNHLHSDDRDRAIEYRVAATRAARNYELEYRMLATDGRADWLRDVVSVVIERGEPSRLAGSRWSTCW